jgi:TATA-box binding protein (TBP) (component of TFIID and TFIIIB)
MSTLEEYVARVEGTCGEEKDVIVTFKYEKRAEAMARILSRAEVKSSFSGIVYELTFKNLSFRLYPSGKAIFRSVRDREELNRTLAALLL